MPSADLDQLAIDLLVLSARFTRLASRESTSSIPRALWRTLAQLDELGPLRVSELAAATHVSQPTATSLLQKLGERGWVERRPDPHDARAVRVSISRSGRRALEQNRKVAAEAMVHRLRRLDDESQAALAGGLAALRLVLQDPPADETDPMTSRTTRPTMENA
ncbi:MAG TPA: MarR family transcriptional regulator [Actinomycetales bacterium]|nr:MarR family transcriptional regulator [Actinomycetales bacterium]